MRFMPTNFARPKARADSTSEGAPTASVSTASKNESAFEDLVRTSRFVCEAVAHSHTAAFSSGACC